MYNDRLYNDDCFANTLELVISGTSLSELYIMKAKRIPNVFDITDYDPNGVVACSESGYMNGIIWAKVRSIFRWHV